MTDQTTFRRETWQRVTTPIPSATAAIFAKAKETGFVDEMSGAQISVQTEGRDLVAQRYGEGWFATARRSDLNADFESVSGPADTAESAAEVALLALGPDAPPSSPTT